jgi:hypothetical protein
VAAKLGAQLCGAVGRSRVWVGGFAHGVNYRGPQGRIVWLAGRSWNRLRIFLLEHALAARG